MNTHGATVNRGEIVSMYAGLKTHEVNSELGGLENMGVLIIQRRPCSLPCKVLLGSWESC